MGELVKQYSQALYTAHKVFRIVQPSAVQEEKEVAINVPMYNDLGEAIGKWKDYAASRFDIRIVAGSTMPVNRWAYLDELKQLLQAGVVDDIAVLAETDIKNKDKIAQRKSLYAQLQSQMSSMEESIKDKEGTIETLERQLVQAGIKQKIMQAEMEVTQKKADTKTAIEKETLETKAQQKHLRNSLKNDTDTKKTQLSYALKDIERDSKAKQANNVKK